MHRVIFYQLDYSIKLNASGKNINFDENRVNKSEFYKNKKLFNIDNIDVNKILISKKEPCSKKKILSFKYFIWYNDNDDIRPLCIRLPQIIGYSKYFDSNKAMSFKVIDKRTIKKEYVY